MKRKTIKVAFIFLSTFMLTSCSDPPKTKVYDEVFTVSADSSLVDSTSTISGDEVDLVVSSNITVKVTETPTPTIIVEEIAEPTPTTVPTIEPTPYLEPIVVEEKPREYLANPQGVVNLIVDTDLGSDIDDAVAVRIATSLAKKGNINLLAVGSCLDGDYAARAIHGILGYDDFPNIRVGMPRRGIDIEQNYTDVLVSKFCDLGTYEKIDCVDLYKQVLRDCDKSNPIRIVTTGFLVNIEDLLRDEEGYQLVANYVDSLWVVGGTYPLEARDFNFWWTEDAIKSIQYVTENSPVPIVYITNSSGCNYDTGMIIFAGGGLPQLDPDYRDPINAAFKEFGESMGWDASGGNACWDGLGVWSASLSREVTDTHIERTDVVITDDGTSIFYPSPNGRHAMLERNSPDMSWYSHCLDELVWFGVR